MRGLILFVCLLVLTCTGVAALTLSPADNLQSAIDTAPAGSAVITLNAGTYMLPQKLYIRRASGRSARATADDSHADQRPYRWRVAVSGRVRALGQSDESDQVSGTDCPAYGSVPAAGPWPTAAARYREQPWHRAFRTRAAW